MLVEQGDDAAVASPCVAHVHLGTDGGGLPDRLAQPAGEQGVRQETRIAPRRDRGERDDRRRHPVRRRLDDAARRRVDSSDDPLDRRERPEPVRQVRQLRTGDAGEEVLGSAGEPGDFVRHRGADDEDEIVVPRRESCVQLHRARPGSSARRTATTPPPRLSVPSVISSDGWSQ